MAWGRTSITTARDSTAPAGLPGRFSTTAGPEISLRSPRAQESLTVRTAARKDSGIEEDVIFLLALIASIALVLVQKPQAFHQQALRVQTGGLLSSLGIEVDLKISARP